MHVAGGVLPALSCHGCIEKPHGSQGGIAHTAPGSFLLSELCFDVANGFVMKDGFVYHQLPESEMVAATQSTREKKREQDGRLLGWSLVNSNGTGH